MRLWAAVLLAGAVTAGCASWPFGRGPALLEKADGLAREGKWDAAVRSYDEYLAEFAGAAAAPRALASRDTVAALLTARVEQARLREEVARLQEDLTRMQSDLTRRETDLIRVRQEADRLRIDLEKLKQIDLRLERRK